MRRSIEYDGIHDEWRCLLEDGKTVVIASSLELLERYLDVLDNILMEFDHADLN